MSTRRAPFAEPAWREDAERFLRARLAALGRPVVGAIEQRHLRPWATAFTRRSRRSRGAAAGWLRRFLRINDRRT